MAASDDAKDVLSALRLGWYLAEVRGRNRPGGPPGAMAWLPDHADHALPLRVERSRTELRIEAQTVVTQLARNLQLDDRGDGTSFGQTIDDLARLLQHVRAPKATAALHGAIDLLQLTVAGQASSGQAGSGQAGSGQAGSGQAGSGQEAPPAPDQAVATLQAALARQQDIVASRGQALADAEQALLEAGQQLAAAAQQPAEVRSRAEADQAAAQATAQFEQAAAAGEQTGVTVLNQAIAVLRQAITADPATAAQACLGPIRAGLQIVAIAAREPWENLAEVIWKFDAQIQDLLAARSETQACGYQLGRGLAETYWALDPDLAAGSRGWNFLLGPERCTEICRLVGRLAAYLDGYTASAIAGSVEVWKDVAAMPNWRGDGHEADHALYRQIRRWYELIILGQDPTTLIKPFHIIGNLRTVGRALRLFWPQLVATIFGLGFLGVLLVSLSVGSGTSLERTLSGVLAAGGLSLAGLTGTLKNSAQAMLKRLRQDAYTELVAVAVLTAPPPPRKSMVRKAISRRGLTPATPN